MRGRQRLVKPEIHSDAELWDAEEETHLPLFRAFVGLWNFADREGRFVWKPRQLKALILPFWAGDFSRVLDALATRHFIVRYTSGTSAFGVIRTFRRHQSINGRESPSELPPPPDDFEDFPLLTDASGTRDSRVDDASTTLHDGIGRVLVGIGSGRVEECPSPEAADDGADAPALSGIRTPSERPPQRVTDQSVEGPVGTVKAPRKSDEAKSALRLALKASFQASGDLTPEVSDGVALKASRRVREFVEVGKAPDFDAAARELVAACRRSGKAFPWCLLDVNPFKGGGAALGRSQPSRGAAADFDNEPDLEEQIRLEKESRSNRS